MFVVKKLLLLLVVARGSKNSKQSYFRPYFARAIKLR